MTTTACLVSEIAERVGVSPEDVINAAMRAGIDDFWLEGQAFRLVSPDVKATFLRMFRLHSDVYAVEFDADDAALERLAVDLGTSVGELREARS